MLGFKLVSFLSCALFLVWNAWIQEQFCKILLLICCWMANVLISLMLSVCYILLLFIFFCSFFYFIFLSCSFLLFRRYSFRPRKEQNSYSSWARYDICIFYVCCKFFCLLCDVILHFVILFIVKYFHKMSWFFKIYLLLNYLIHFCEINTFVNFVFILLVPYFLYLSDWDFFSCCI